MPFEGPNPNLAKTLNNIVFTMHKRIENRSSELNGLIDAMLQKKQDDRPSIKDLFLNFPILREAIIALLEKFLPV